MEKPQHDRRDNKGPRIVSRENAEELLELSKSLSKVHFWKPPLSTVCEDKVPSSWESEFGARRPSRRSVEYESTKGTSVADTLGPRKPAPKD